MTQHYGQVLGYAEYSCSQWDKGQLRPEPNRTDGGVYMSVMDKSKAVPEARRRDFDSALVHTNDSSVGLNRIGREINWDGSRELCLGRRLHREEWLMVLMHLNPRKLLSLLIPMVGYLLMYRK